MAINSTSSLEGVEETTIEFITQGRDGVYEYNSIGTLEVRSIENGNSETLFGGTTGDLCSLLATTESIRELLASFIISVGQVAEFTDRSLQIYNIIVDIVRPLKRYNRTNS